MEPYQYARKAETRWTTALRAGHSAHSRVPFVHGALRRTLDCGPYSARLCGPNVRVNADRGGRQRKPGL